MISYGTFKILIAKQVYNNQLTNINTINIILK